MQSETKSRVDQLTSPAGHPVTVLRFEGDIASTSKGRGPWAPTRTAKETAKLILLDFSKVDYINSSGIALVIQLLIEASNSPRRSTLSGFRRTLPRCSPWWGLPNMPGCLRDRRGDSGAVGNHFDYGERRGLRKNCVLCPGHDFRTCPETLKRRRRWDKRNIPQGAKAPTHSAGFMYGLKPVPFTKIQVFGQILTGCGKRADRRRILRRTSRRG